MPKSNLEHFDVLIIGAGLSGIGAAYHLQTMCPERTYAILEGREAIGGTWDLFRYPGIRSDSDMYTLGYRSGPGRGGKAIADGASILAYVREHGAEVTASTRRFAIGHRVDARRVVVGADARWTVSAERRARARPGPLHVQLPLHRAPATTTTRAATRPEFPGRDRFRGRDRAPAEVAGGPRLRGQARRRHRQRGHRRHPRAGELAQAAAHVTMLQRSPTYIVALPEQDRIADLAARAPPGGDGLRDHPLEERAHGHVLLPARAPPPGARQEPDPQGHAALPRPRLRRRYALHADVQAVGPAALRRAGRRLLPGAPRRGARRS